MEDNYKVQLGQDKNVNSVNVDNYIKIDLSQKIKETTEYDLNSVLSVSDIFELERQQSQDYRVYGKIEYLSLLNNLSNSYSSETDFFLPTLINSKNLLNSFNFYLVKPVSSGYTYCSGVPSLFEYIRYFEVIATPDDFQIFPAGFSKNLYNEQDYCFNFNNSFDISGYFDNFGIPLTELFLYCQYKTTSNGLGVPETIYYKKFDLSGNSSQVRFIPISFNIGDKINYNGINHGDLIQYIDSSFYQQLLVEQEYNIRIPIKTGSTTVITHWKYNPFISLQLRYFSEDLKTANISGTSYVDVNSIPDYAINLGSGNYVWRDILDQGFIDPISGIGVDYPFINKKIYLFSNIVLEVIPDLLDAVTNNIFNNIVFPVGITKKIIPSGGLNNFGKPC